MDEDIARLRAAGFEVDVLREDSRVGVLICRYVLPRGSYNLSETDLLLQTDLQYPTSAMDMLWVEPQLLMASGAVPAGGESLEHHFGRDWRRLSWHRNTPWVPGRDDLVGHFEFAASRLALPK